ncbi:cobalamin-dependent protein [Micromonospora sp. NBC_01699]|uniref:cobalamin B12-binding domain-containing protein n=1 Tax=Micromonospora sp. NBC_01699 TaxID=2975984 RepID=UPI002E2BFE25|nr:cobalamin-dependent protein [Micromonospora sp. NBC_01699]
MPSAEPAAARGTVIVSGLVSDAHTWNLVFLQLLLEEQGYRVVNLGPCVPEQLLVDECARLAPTLVVLSSVNGHGYADGLRAIAALRAAPELAGLPVVIGGKLGVSDDDSGRARELAEAGFDSVFTGGPDELTQFAGYLTRLRPGSAPADAPAVAA